MKILNAIERELKHSENLLRECSDLSSVFLEPILSKLKLSKRIKGRSLILHRLATCIEYPTLMWRAYEREDFEEVIIIFEKLLGDLRSSPSKTKYQNSVPRVLNAVWDKSMALWLGILFPTFDL